MTEDGRTVVVLGDPVSGRYFRLREVEGTILSLLDGRQELAAIHEEVSRMFPGRRVPLEAVTAFVAQVERLGLLEGVKGDPPRRSLIQRVLFLKLSLINPDRMLDRLYRRAAFLYQPWAMALAVLLVLLASVVAATSTDDLRRSFVPPGTWAGVLLLWLSISLITLIHELGHGLTCKHFGARATGFGLLFIYFLPCFYCDVSGAWTLRRRSQRLWVGAAGLCFQFVTGAVALLVWRVVDPTSWLGRMCLAMVSVCGVDALLNLMPLLRLDGYYLLSDWLEIPNLRGRALGHVGGRLRRWLLGLQGTPTDVTPRQARIFLVYGTLAGLFAVVMMSWSAFSLYRWFYGRFGGIGAIALGGLTLLLFAAPTARMFGLWLRALRSDGEASGPAARPPAPAAAAPGPVAASPGPAAMAPERGAPVPAQAAAAAPPHPVVSTSRPPAPAAPRRAVTPSPRFRAVALAAVVPAVAAALAFGQSSLNVVGSCRLEALRSAPVRVARAGVLKELNFREGDWVREGSLVGSLDTFSLQKELSSLQSRANTLRVEAEITRRQADFTARQRASEAADKAAEVPPSRIALQEVTSLHPFRLAEARSHVQAALAILTAAVERQRQLRAEVDAMPQDQLPPSLRALRARVDETCADLRGADREVERLKPLVKIGAIAERELDQAATRRDVLETVKTARTNELEAAKKELREQADRAAREVERAHAEYEGAQERYEQEKQQAAPQRIAGFREVYRARENAARHAASLEQERELQRPQLVLKRLEGERIRTLMGLMQKRIDQSRVIAPTSGIVATPRVEQRLGREFSAGEAVCMLDLTGQVQVRVFVDERDVGVIDRGAPVQLKIAAFPDRVFDGQVREIVRHALTANGRNSYEVRLRVRNPGGQLMPGMTGWAKIGCGRRSWGALLARRVMRYVRTEAWSWF